jgi:hypothetical protein
MNDRDEQRIQDARDAADDDLLRAELEGRADDHLERECRERDAWGPHPDDVNLGPRITAWEFPIRRAS